MAVCDAGFFAETARREVTDKRRFIFFG